jgi:serine phosphatase RsbU (regulator of sigma subunit)
VGGDYFDYFRIDEHKIGVAVADVSGKGTSAAFYMATIKGMMVSLAGLVESPKRLLCTLNEKLYATLDKQVFATMLYGVLDIKNRQLTFVRAGHNALMVRRNGGQPDVEFHIPPGIGLGLTDNDIFNRYIEEKTIRLSADDVCLFYTDGISEAMNRNLEEFGEQQLSDVLRQSAERSVDGIQADILHRIKRFSEDRPQNDDITMVVVRLTS